MSGSKVPLICGVLVVVGAIAWFAGGSADALPYRDGWGDATEEARRTGKPILISYGGSW
jgi:hypothetical protein